MDNRPLIIKSMSCFENSFPFYVGRDEIDGYVGVHQHDFVEIEFTVSGQGSEKINGISHELKPGNMTVLFPWDCHDIRADSGSTLVFCKINFNMELFMAENCPLYLLRGIPFGKLNQTPYVTFDGKMFERILSLYEALETEFARADAFREVMFYIKTAELLVEYGRAIRASDTDNLRENNRSAVEYIHQNYSLPLEIDSLAAGFGMTGKQLDSQLKEQTGMNLSELINDIRIRNACARLIYHTVSVAQIARETGFPPEDSFSKAFKRAKGISPANYRKKYMAEDNNLLSPDEIDSRIIYYLHFHYSDDLSLSDIAKEFHYNENYLRQLIKAQTGQTFSDLLSEVRVFHAAGRLCSGDEPVAEIGYAVGFSSNETFLRIFKKHYGCSPSAYRTQKSR